MEMNKKAFSFLSKLTLPTLLIVFFILALFLLWERQREPSSSGVSRETIEILFEQKGKKNER